VQHPNSFKVPTEAEISEAIGEPNSPEEAFENRTEKGQIDKLE
jgi:hypothetical protein